MTPESKPNEMLPEHKCPHCEMDKRIRNPSGYCDHLYYPEHCDICKQTFSAPRLVELDKEAVFKFLEEVNPSIVNLHLSELLVAKFGHSPLSVSKDEEQK